jgi:hypothetical protein
VSGSVRTAVTVMVGVVLGGVILVGIGALAGIVDLSGTQGGSGTSGGGGGTDVDQIIEEPEGPSRQDKIDEWCNSEAGDEVQQLGSATTATQSAKKMARITDAMLEVTRDAPAGADCAVLELDSLRDSWNLYTGDPSFRRYRPTAQAKRIREFQSDQDLAKAYEGF